MLNNNGRMKKRREELTERIVKLLKDDQGQPVRDLAKERYEQTFLAGCLKALENQGYVKSKKMGPARV